ncbi:hypothetical protein [Psychroserpens mesophilus]|uniref:hypothetical protein n=1 Tax=Psychroserpens mesophilus TaxID=325473 RepID=UPI003D6525DC
MNIKEEIIIEGQRVDLFEGGKISRTLTINSLGNITAKQSSYSNTIKLPKTSNNTRIFEGLGIAGNNTQLPYNRLRCSYYYNTIPIFVDGYAIIQSVTPETYNLTIYNGIIELGEALKGKKLSDLNLSGLTHSISIEDYQTYINDDTSNFNYSIITDNVQRPESYPFEDNISASTYNLSETLPFIKAEYVFNKIIEEAGFEVDGDLFEDANIYDSFKKEYISLSEGYVVDAPLEIITENIGDIETTEFNIEEVNEHNVGTEPLPDDIYRLDDVSNTSFSSTTEITIDAGSFTTNFSDIIRINISANYNIRFADYLRLILYQNGVEFRVINMTQSFGANIQTEEIELFTNDGDVYTWKLEANSKYSLKYIDFSSGFVFGEWLEYNFTFDYNIGINDVQPVTVSGNEMKLGDVKQLDFIKDITNRYGLLLNKSETSNVITTKNINNLLIGIDGFVDYTSKLNRKKSEEFTNSYAQENFFKWKYGKNPNSEIDTTGFYDDSFLLDNKLATSEKTIFTSIFEVINNNLFTTSYFDDYYQTYSSLKHNLIAYDEELIYEPVENKLKLVNLHRSDDKVDYSLYFNGTPAVPINDYFNYLTLPKPYSEVFDEYYSSLIEVLDKYKTVKVEFNFNLADIKNFDFYKLIFLKQTGQYYFCNKLKYNVTSTQVEAELVEVGRSVNLYPEECKTWTVRATGNPTEPEDAITITYYDCNNQIITETFTYDLDTIICTNGVRSIQFGTSGDTYNGDPFLTDAVYTTGSNAVVTNTNNECNSTPCYNWTVRATGNPTEPEDAITITYYDCEGDEVTETFTYDLDTIICTSGVKSIQFGVTGDLYVGSPYLTETEYTTGSNAVVTKTETQCS